MVLGYITNACSLTDFISAAMKRSARSGGDVEFGNQEDAVTQYDVANEIVGILNRSQWKAISTAPKTRDDFVGGAIEVLAWCPDSEARSGGDKRIVWWEPGINGGCWWSERDRQEHPAAWLDVTDVPDTIKGASA
ncbi:hypothetical protein [Rhizobium azibense]|nr:hypothetical protein [Rhizobium azibense]